MRYVGREVSKFWLVGAATGGSSGGKGIAAVVSRLGSLPHHLIIEISGSSLTPGNERLMLTLKLLYGSW